MSTLLTVMAHGGAQETFDRHQKTWEAQGHEMLVFCPENDRIQSIHPVFAFGHATHHSPHAIERFRTLLLHLESTPHDQFIIHEYDSISLAPAVFEPLTLRGNVFHEDSHRWLGKLFIHPPLALDRIALERIVAGSGAVPDHSEKGMWDRWLGLVCGMFEIRVTDWGAQGFSHNTIEPEFIQSAIEAKKTGAVHYHGIKDKRTLNAILNA